MIHQFGSWLFYFIFFSTVAVAVAKFDLFQVTKPFEVCQEQNQPGLKRKFEIKTSSDGSGWPRTLSN
jgi:hypothetical protein